PFLLPLMLQVGFGLSAFESGTLTFTAAAGAVTMKLTASPILRRWGFRRVLCLNALICTALVAATAAFTARTPHLAIMSVLLIGGFFRSLQFTSLNTLNFADIDAEHMSQATSFVAVMQQLSQAAGVAVAAMLLDGLRTHAGRVHLTADDFAHAFIAIALLSLLSIEAFRRLAPDAGAEVSGHGQHNE
ncbi:MAG TPA: MFS transporter, partial [Giesbergeria sp.]|nr:MFS transporter [Giesbergeria sp.]